MNRPSKLPDNLSPKQKASMAGRRGRKASHWSGGFASPLSVAGTEDWHKRRMAWKEEKQK